MKDVTIMTKKGLSIKVIPASAHNNHISRNDAEMDARASKAVRVAVEKAKFCKKPVAKYDPITKRAYLEHANGYIEYVN